MNWGNDQAEDNKPDEGRMIPLRNRLLKAERRPPQPSVNHPHLRFGKYGAHSAAQAVVAMSGAQPEKSTGRRGKAVCALLLATSILALLRPGALHAQETELRGEVSESAILSDQQRKARQLALAAQGQQAPADAATDNTPPRTYLPASAGAVPDDTNTDAATAAGSIFDPPQATDDTATDNPTPPKPRRRPSTTGQNAADQDKTKAGTKAADKSKKKKKTTAATTDTTASTTASTTDAAGATDTDEETEIGRAHV